jgi:hypothetical protein
MKISVADVRAAARESGKLYARIARPATGTGVAHRAGSLPAPAQNRLNIKAMF